MSLRYSVILLIIVDLSFRVFTELYMPQPQPGDGSKTLVYTGEAVSESKDGF
jgi:hypothetical protein